eukprot:c39009_g1_i1 orf=2-235(-)
MHICTVHPVFCAMHSFPLLQATAGPATQMRELSITYTHESMSRSSREEDEMESRARHCCFNREELSALHLHTQATLFT